MTQRRKTMKHERTTYSSIFGLSMKLNGQELLADAISSGRTTCSCGWDSGLKKTGAAAQEAFERHQRSAARRRA